MLPTLVAAVPMLTVVVLMLAAKWPATRAGAAGLGVAWFSAWGVFGYGREIYGQQGVIVATAGFLTEAGFAAITILWIIFPALCIHHLQVRTGAVEVLRAAITRLSPDPRLMAIIVAWFFALFIEGAAGFGTTVALAAPLLVSLGFQPLAAVTMALIGHAVGVSFGAVGTPILPQMAATGLSAMELARINGAYHALLGWVMLGLVMLVVARAKAGEAPAARPLWGWTGLAAVCFLLPYGLLAYGVGPELPTLGGALVGGVGFVGVLKLRAPGVAASEPEAGREASSLETRQVLHAATPYLVLVGVVLCTRLIPPLQHTLTGLAWTWTLFDTFRGTVQPLYHPGTMLWLALLLGAVWQGAAWLDLRAVMARTARQLGPVTIALIAMLGLSRLMVHAGMITTLATAAAGAAGVAWPFLAPFVGVLGTFVTGSATASNILLSDFQQATAQQLGLPLLTMIGAQGFGAAVGNIICPHNLIAGGATVGLVGQEGAILRRTLWACAVYATLGGLLTLVWV